MSFLFCVASLLLSADSRSIHTNNDIQYTLGVYCNKYDERPRKDSCSQNRFDHDSIFGMSPLPCSGAINNCDLGGSDHEIDKGPLRALCTQYEEF